VTAIGAAVAQRATLQPAAPLRIELVVPSLPAAGMEVMVAALARSLVERGHAIGVTCTDDLGPLAEIIKASGIRVSFVAAPGFISGFYRPNPLAEHLRRLAPDVVHSHSGVWSRAAAAAVAAGARVVVNTEHGLPEPDPWYGRALMRWSMRQTTHLVAVSDALWRYLTTTVGLHPAQLSIIVNGIDTGRYAPGPRSPEVRARLGAAPGRRLVGIVARFSPVKNHAFLLDAFARLAPRVPDVDLALVGQGPLQGALEAQAAALGIADRVRFAGLAADTAPVYRELDVFVLTSVSEGTSMSVLEAMATGMPIVATAVGGTPHLLEDGACGRLVPSGDVGALADALEAALAGGADTRAMAERARARTVAEFSHERMVDRYEALYRSLVPARG
jgi:glycosyltransferase involved in cell wall biosynthesis